MKILISGKHPVLEYAADELATYVGRVSAGRIRPVIEVVEQFPASGQDAILLGLLGELGRPSDDVGDSLIDDVVDVEVRNGSGLIAGSNPRSVLLGVYAYLKSAGCLWVRPGDDGEHVPECDLTAHSFVYRKKADYSFRGQCIEGAVSFENVRDTVRWLPKVGMNLFMMEQIVPYNYMSRWYKHAVSTVKRDEGVSFEQVGEYVVLLEQEIKRCGLQLHALGHGYLLEPYGIHYRTASDTYTLSADAQREVALVGGKRGLFHGSPNFTHLCYSNPVARGRLVQFLTDYARKKPYIDFLHVWLADAVGNQCECAECAKFAPSDLYVRMLNELDAELTHRGIDTRIVFIMYTDTLWPPRTERFRNPRRFILTTALGRSYSQSYSRDECPGPLPEYRRNDYRVPASFPLRMKFYDAWRKVFEGPAFAFEYHFYTDHFHDPGYYDMARILFEDVKRLGGFGFRGLMSDQTQRSFFPNGFPLSLLGEALFDSRLDLDTYAERYFTAAYGQDAAKCREYLAGISRLFDPPSLRDDSQDVVQQDTGTGEKAAPQRSWTNNAEAAERFARVPCHVDAFLPVIRKNLEHSRGSRAKSWKLLLHHAEYCARLSRILGSGARGDMTAARAQFGELIDWLSRIEDEIQPDFDLVLFHQVMSRKLREIPRPAAGAAGT